jgi:hypothetical protein
MKWFRQLVERLEIAWANFWLKRTAPKFAACLESGALDAFLELLFRLMSLVLLVDKRFRRNIEGFEVSYLFRSRDDSVVASLEFHKGRLKVRSNAIDDPDITVTFKDNAALKDFLLSEQPDLIGAILDNEISYVGNLNYLGKLAYMAKHLQLQFAPPRAA